MKRAPFLVSVIALFLAGCTPSPANVVQGLRLYSDATNNVPFTNGAVLEPNRLYFVEAVTDAEVDRVDFTMDGTTTTVLSRPFRSQAGSPALGNHTFKATAYNKRGKKKWQIGNSVTVTFSVATVQPTPTPTATPTPTPTVTPTPTPIPSPTPTPTISPPTPTPTLTPTPTPRPTPTPTPTPSATPIPTPSITPPPTPTATPTSTPSPTPTPTPTATPTPTPVNKAPTVNLDPIPDPQFVDQAISLAGRVSDDGLPHGQVTYSWDAPGGTLEPADTYMSQLNITVTYMDPGQKTVTFGASDGELTSTTSRVFTVNPTPTPVPTPKPTPTPSGTPIATPTPTGTPATIHLQWTYTGDNPATFNIWYGFVYPTGPIQAILDQKVGISGAMRIGTISLPDGRQRQFMVTAVAANGMESLGSNQVGWPAPATFGVVNAKVVESPEPAPSPNP